MRVCVHRGECVHVYVSVCVVLCFKKKKTQNKRDQGSRQDIDLSAIVRLMVSKIVK